MSRQTVMVMVCDNCGKQFSKDGLNAKYIGLDKGDLDAHGIWDGLSGHHIWFADETFDNFDCLIEWLKKKHAELMQHKEASL